MQHLGHDFLRFAQTKTDCSDHLAHRVERAAQLMIGPGLGLLASNQYPVIIFRTNCSLRINGVAGNTSAHPIA